MRSSNNLHLTEEEAAGLLDIVMMAPVELTDEQLAATTKLSHCCKGSMLQSTEAGGESGKSTIEIHGRPPVPASFTIPR